ncbi:hypothetical protein [Parahaliea mediterranea]|uniref:DUF7933 domain-containing protein n=1 Tax=Parahaliea mediterranea TaxID=651086 RepID=A0A939ILQ9_9GAMM|nr:hypothetical protein [Parahaliea mediterranea]MBN7798646.1 hypothetical protein [Parahaliea mediterranea]
MKTIVTRSVVLASLMGALPSMALELAQSFAPIAIGPGSTARLEYRLTNASGIAQTGIAFDNTLPANVSLAAVPLGGNDCGGRVSAQAGGTAISFDDGRLGGGQSCRLVVNVVSTVPGTHINALGNLSSDQGSYAVGAAADLFVDAGEPGFYVSSVTPANPSRGEVVELTYTIDNLLNPGGATLRNFDIAFPDGVTVASEGYLDSACVLPVVDEAANSVNVGALNVGGLIGEFPVNAGDSCSFTVGARLDTAGQVDISTPVLQTGGFSSVEVGFASVRIAVAPQPLHISAGFHPSVAAPGETVYLSFDLSNTDRGAAAGGLGFTYDLGAQFGASVAVGEPAVQGCGGSFTAGSTLQLVGGGLPAGGSCRIELPLQVPAGLASGRYNGLGSAVSASVAGNPVTGNSAAASLFLSDRPVWQKTFLEPVVVAGDEVTLRYTLTNTSGSENLDELSIQESLHSVDYLGHRTDCDAQVAYVPNLTNTRLTVALNQLLPTASCEVEVDLRIPESASTGTLELGTISALYNGNQEVKVLTDTLDIVAGPGLLLAFEPAAALPGDTVDLVATLGAGPAAGRIDQDEYEGYADVGFSLDLNAIEPGLVANGLPQSDACGAGSSLDGSSGVVTLGGGTLAPGESCTLRLPLQLPAGAAYGTLAVDDLRAMAQVRGRVAGGAPASAELAIAGAEVTLEQVAPLPVAPGATAQVRVTVRNLTPTEAISGLALILDYDSDLPGLPTPTPIADDFCGAGSSMAASGTILQLSNLSLAPGGDCVFELEFPVSPGLASGDYAMPIDSLSYVVQGAPVTAAPDSLFRLAVLAPGEDVDVGDPTPGSPDSDGDGLDTAAEWPLGDVNGDGIRDALQGNVAAMVSAVTGSPVALEFDSGCRLERFAMVAAVDDGDNSYPEGLADFSLECARSEVVLYLPGMDFSAGDLAVRKFGPRAPAFGADQWYAMPATIDAVGQRIRFELVDGQLGDSTGVDGRLVDPVGLAVLAAVPPSVPGGAVAIPVNQPWVLLLAVLAILRLAALRQRR